MTSFMGSCVVYKSQGQALLSDGKVYIPAQLFTKWEGRGCLGNLSSLRSNFLIFEMLVIIIPMYW